MKTIEFWAHGKVFADADCEDEARTFLADTVHMSIAVANDLFITAVRVLIHEGVIPHEEVRFLFRGQFLQPDRNGRLGVWPEGFCDTSEGLLSRLLRSHS